jgi:hypothetical protein
MTTSGETVERITDIAERSQAAVTTAVRRWIDAAERSSAAGFIGDPANPPDADGFLNEFFDFFDKMVSDQREVARQWLAAAENATADGKPPQSPATATTTDQADEADFGMRYEPTPHRLTATTPPRRGAVGAKLSMIAGVPLPDADERGQESAALAELAEAFSTLVRALVVEDDVTAITPARLIQLAATCLPRVKDAAFIAAQNGTPRCVAATTDLPSRVDQIRAATGQGPALDVLDTTELVVSNDLATDQRWPQFSRRVVDEVGLRSVVSYRLHLDPRHHAALTFYSDWPYAFDNLDITIGALFAAYSSLMMFGRLPHRTSGQLSMPGRAGEPWE